MPGTPWIVRKPEIQISKRTGDSDGSDVDVLMRRIRLQDVDRAVNGGLETSDLSVPSIFPGLALLAAAGHRSIENSVAQCLKLQRPPPWRTVPRKQRPLLAQAVEIFADQLAAK